MKNWQWMILGIIIGIAASGAILIIASPAKNSEFTFVSPTQVSKITISVIGEVNHPGVFDLPVGSRVNDAILAAGGQTANADLSSINLARVLNDADQVNVLSIQTLSTTQSQTQGKININSAGVDQLDSLPGVGPEKAQAIIDFRTQNGPFISINDLLYVPGFGQSLFASIEDLIDVK